MTETTQPDPQVTRCPWCEGHPRPCADHASQPDPQVVAWMRDYLRRRPNASQYAAVTAGVDAFRRSALQASVTSTVLADAYEAARKPLTVADVPAGQGVASLFLMRSERWGGSFPVLFYRDENGHPRPIHRPGVGGYPEGVDALWDHLAATLRHVTAEETP